MIAGFDIGSYAQLKNHIAWALGLAKDAVHMYAGFFMMLVSMVFLRRSLRSYHVLVLGWVVSVVIEILDLRFYYMIGRGWTWRDSVHDLIHTNMIPLIIVLLARRGLIKL